MRVDTHILLVDDETSIRESLAQYLEDFGFQVTTVTTAEDALQLLTNQRFDVAIADVRLPGMNGDQFVIQAASRYPHMHFLFHTGSISFSLNGQLRQLGLTDEHILRKPLFDLTKIVQAIRQLAS